MSRLFVKKLRIFFDSFFYQLIEVLILTRCDKFIKSPIINVFLLDNERRDMLKVGIIPTFQKRNNQKIVLVETVSCPRTGVILLENGGGIIPY